MVGIPELPLDDWIIFNMIAYAVFTLGAIIIYKQQKELMMIPLFFIVVGVFLNTFGHIAFSIYNKGYTSGLYTVLIYLGLIPFIFKAFKNG